MNVRCVDPLSFSAEVVVKRGSTIADLKAILESQFQFNASRCSVFTCGKEWKDTDVIRQKKGDPRLFVFVDRECYYEKSYPAVEGVFNFPQTRFGKPPVRRTLEDPPIDFADFPLEAPPPPPQARRRVRRELPQPEQPPPEQVFDYDIGGVTVRLIASEEAAVRRLLELGFDFQTVLQVFVACDRDENAARECLRGMR